MLNYIKNQIKKIITNHSNETNTIKIKNEDTTIDKKIIYLTNCIVCGKPLQNKRKGIKLCGSRQCLNKRKYYTTQVLMQKRKEENNIITSYETALPNNEDYNDLKRFCVICGKDITHLKHKTKLCTNINCDITNRKENNRKNYLNSRKNKNHVTLKCPVCNKIFIGENNKRLSCSVTCTLKLKETIKYPPTLKALKDFNI